MSKVRSQLLIQRQRNRIGGRNKDAPCSCPLFGREGHLASTARFFIGRRQTKGLKSKESPNDVPVGFDVQ